jgi:beta-glucosidase
MTTYLPEPSVVSTSTLSLEEKIGLLFHPMILLGDELDVDTPSAVGPSIRELIVDRGIRFFTLGGLPEPSRTADQLAALQDFARAEGAQAPLTFSTDPRHAFLNVEGVSHSARGVSQWPEPLGLGALDDEALVREFSDIVRRDYIAMGIRMALHPQADLATEPRWARQAQTFGADPERAARLVVAAIAGLQGETLGASSVAATTKHFPGAGPQLDGEDAHFPYGREQVYPGGRFDEHLRPFVAAIEAGTAAIMPYYGMPVGLELDGRAVPEVGFAYNRRIITELLRDTLGYDGVVLSDFGLITDQTVFGLPFPARAWGVEHLTRSERAAALLHAGVDQIGGEYDTSLIVELLQRGVLDEARIDESARRLVALQSALYEAPHSTPDAAVGGQHAIRLGLNAQSRSMVLVSQDKLALPLAGSLAVHTIGLDPSALPKDWRAVVDPADADLAIVRIGSPFTPRNDYFLESGMEQGSLELDPATVQQLSELAAKTRVVLVIRMTRPAVLSPILEHLAIVLADFGASDEAVIAVLAGLVAPEGRLPFELPRSMDSVQRSRPDVADDTGDALFPQGWSAAVSADGTGAGLN